MKDLGETDVILNIKLIKGEKGINLLHSHYVEKVLSRFGYTDSKPSPTPYEAMILVLYFERIRDQEKITSDTPKLLAR